MACPAHSPQSIATDEHELVAERSEAERNIIQTTLEEFKNVLRNWHTSIIDELRARGVDAVASGSARVFLRDALDPYRQSFDVTIQAMWNDGADQGREHAIQRHNLDISFDLQRPEVRGAIEENARRASAHIQRRMVGDLGDALAEAHDEGVGIDEITRVLQEDVFPQMRGYEAERVARTEVISGSNKGADVAYSGSSATQKEWLATRDSRTRTSHRYSTGVGGQVVAIDEPFRWQNHTAQYPGDPSLPPSERANCRCAHAPVFD